MQIPFGKGTNICRSLPEELSPTAELIEIKRPTIISASFSSL